MTMDVQLKERLVGAGVLVLCAVLFIPMVLDGPNPDRQVSQPVELPAADESERRTVRIDLQSGGTTARDASANGFEEPAAIDLTPAQEAKQAATLEQPEIPVVRAEKPAAETAKTQDEVSAAERKAAAPASTRIAPWTVQVGSFSQSDNAEALAAKLRGLEFPAYVSRFRDGNRTHYRVRVGGFPSRDAAQIRAQEIRAKTGEPASPVQNQ